MSSSQLHATEKQFLRVCELADLLDVKPSWIYDRTGNSGPELIPHLKLGRQLRFDLQSETFRAWLNSHAATPVDTGRS